MSRGGSQVATGQACRPREPGQVITHMSPGGCTLQPRPRFWTLQTQERGGFCCFPSCRWPGLWHFLVAPKANEPSSHHGGESVGAGGVTGGAWGSGGGGEAHSGVRGRALDPPVWGGTSGQSGGLGLWGPAAQAGWGAGGELWGKGHCQSKRDLEGQTPVGVARATGLGGLVSEAQEGRGSGEGRRGKGRESQALGQRADR